MQIRMTCLLGVLLAACGGSAPPPSDATDADEVPSPPTAWESMDHEAKAQWMSDEVVPRMSAVFSEHDAQRYADFGCATCHGPNPRERNFEMPALALPALPASGTPEQQQMSTEYGPMVRFMFNRVLPTMQTLVGGEDYDEATQQGFSCFSCHPRAGTEGSTLIRLSAPPDA